ncbi:MAG: hypothetical protein AAF529_14580 [Pseudomonadota bacterium]
MTSVKKYKKGIAAAVGFLAILIGPDMLNVSDSPLMDAETVVELVVAILGVYGVVQLKNEH